MKKILKNNCAGALLFAIMIAFVLSLIGATMVFLAGNQYRLIMNEIERIRASYILQTGAEYAIYYAYNFPDQLLTLPKVFPPMDPDPEPPFDPIFITIDSGGPGEYTIETTKLYGQ